ncbi:hypothetical protein FRC09_013399 [Ceratobasidium sp. 395]|nr:hypothetical protein FRC09_013399 [Ceratobasidium sp. 395]
MPPSRTEKEHKTRGAVYKKNDTLKAKTADLNKRIARNGAKAKRETPQARFAAANSHSSDELQNKLTEYLGTPPKKGNKKLVWTVYTGPQLKKSPQKDNVWSLFELNMHDLYEEAKDPHVKWDPADKEKELFNSKSRYILLETSDQSELAAFCMFRFEADENYEGNMEFLIYEMQVSKKFQGLGVCRSVFDALERLSSEFEVQLIMLTVFKCNLKAIAVYEHLEYKEHIDTTDTLLVLHKTIS